MGSPRADAAGPPGPCRSGESVVRLRCARPLREAAVVREAEQLERLSAVGRQDEPAVETEQAEQSPEPRRHDDCDLAPTREHAAACIEQGVEDARADGLGVPQVDDDLCRSRLDRLRDVVAVDYGYEGLMLLPSLGLK